LVNRRIINVALIIFSARNARAGVYRAHIHAPRPDERSLRSERGAVINNKSTQRQHRVRARRTSDNEFRDYVRPTINTTFIAHYAFTGDISCDARIPQCHSDLRRREARIKIKRLFGKKIVKSENLSKYKITKEIERSSARKSDEVGLSSELVISTFVIHVPRFLPCLVTL